MAWDTKLPWHKWLWNCAIYLYLDRNLDHLDLKTLCADLVMLQCFWFMVSIIKEWFRYMVKSLGTNLHYSRGQVLHLVFCQLCEQSKEKRSIVYPSTKCRSLHSRSFDINNWCDILMRKMNSTWLAFVVTFLLVQTVTKRNWAHLQQLNEVIQPASDMINLTVSNEHFAFVEEHLNLLATVGSCNSVETSLWRHIRFKTTSEIRRHKEYSSVPIKICQSCFLCLPIRLRLSFM